MHILHTLHRSLLATICSVHHSVPDSHFSRVPCTGNSESVGRAASLAFYLSLSFPYPSCSSSTEQLFESGASWRVKTDFRYAAVEQNSIGVKDRFGDVLCVGVGVSDHRLYEYGSELDSCFADRS